MFIFLLVNAVHGFVAESHTRSQIKGHKNPHTLYCMRVKIAIQISGAKFVENYQQGVDLCLCSFVRQHAGYQHTAIFGNTEEVAVSFLIIILIADYLYHLN